MSCTKNGRAMRARAIAMPIGNFFVLFIVYTLTHRCLHILNGLLIENAGGLESGFAFTAGWLNIALYIGYLALGFALSAKLSRSGAISWLCGVLVILAGLYGAALILFTMAPPALPIFLD